MIGTALAVAGVTLAAGLVLAALASRIASLRGRLVALALIAVVLPLAAVMASGVLMFDTGHDLTVLAAATASATAALAGALLVARSVLEPVGRIRRASTALAGGDLGARAPEDGPVELVDLGRDFNLMAGELERLFDARRELVAHASHDLRTPLASLQAMIEAVEDGLAPAEEYLPAMADEVRRMGRRVDDLFELARIDAGQLAVELRDVPLDGLVGECVRGVSATAHARGVRLSARVEDATPPARCAPEHVERILLNLLANALRHTPADGSVQVVLGHEPEGVRLSVEDTGEGIAEEDLDRAFERFWRADSARGAGAGAGLGLTIAKGLAEAQGGRLWAERRPGGGARVSLLLPAGATA